MIRLAHIILEYEEGFGDKIDTDEHDPMSVWVTDKKLWAGKNTYGQIRYFKNRTDATKYSSGETKGADPSRKVVKKKGAKLSKQRYS